VLYVGIEQFIFFISVAVAYYCACLFCCLTADVLPT